MVNSLKMKMLYVTLGLITASSASAKVYVNSMCTMRANSQNKVIDGDNNKDDKFPLASISKVVTTLWAIEKLGPDYRFTTKLHVNRVGNNAYDVHIEGSRDPLISRNTGYFLVSELNRAGIDIKNIERLSFDENFLINWGLEEHPGIDTPYYRTMQAQVEAVRGQLVANFITPIDFGKNSAYNILKARAAKIGVSMESTPKINVRQVEFVSKKDFVKQADTTTLLYRSTPLKTILKRMNNQSNNYIADNLYWNLGGTSEFNKYLQSSLSLSTNEMEFYLGSGNNADYILNPGGKAVYNEATCEAMIKVLYKLDKSLEAKGLQLSDVMAVAGKDNTSTVAEKYGYGGVFAGSTVAKTGSVDKAKTLAGTVSTAKGEIYFVVLMNTDGRSEWGSASGVIKEKVKNLINSNGGPKDIGYKNEIIALPFDAASKLQNAANISLGKK
ncbi:D-alanyl-D-alanine carboxypeptidase [Bdellovibrio sp. HCB-162]|uniref:D-alanyl-D-alanine carboxypeptidase n=1 Tax=Bdellovibrio sp. HCB-162 TaxID=3394234 RepID=UPI0039BD4F8E